MHGKRKLSCRKPKPICNKLRPKLLLAQANVERAMVVLQLAKQKVAVAEKAVADAKKPKPLAEDAVFTVHVRPLTEAEKVIRVKATGKETVLEGLAYATEAAAIKSGEVSVWVVREKVVIAVDLNAILKGDAKTNVTLKAGDQLFVQVKPVKLTFSPARPRQRTRHAQAAPRCAGPHVCGPLSTGCGWTAFGHTMHPCAWQNMRCRRQITSDGGKNQFQVVGRGSRQSARSKW